MGLTPLSILKTHPAKINIMKVNNFTALQILDFFNPFISITPSKPLMSSGSWLTLHNYKIFYLLAVNYDPATTDIIFIRVNIHPGPGEGDSQLIF
jgi:hypothetical protein